MDQNLNVKTKYVKDQKKFYGVLKQHIKEEAEHFKTLKIQFN